jgi:hypothetical protein
VEAILDAWHERHIDRHLEQLRAVAEADGSPLDCLNKVLTALAEIQRRRRNHDTPGPELDLTSFLHRPDGAARAAAANVYKLVLELMTQCASQGEIRGDIKPEELTHYCLHALEAAGDTKSTAAVNRLIDLVLTSVRA